MHVKKILVIIPFLMIQANAVAQSPTGPITEKTLIGTWEAVSDDKSHVFRMEIRDRGPSLLVSAGRDGKSPVYKLQKKVINNGKLFMVFSETGNRAGSVQLVGDGTAAGDDGKDEGVINASLVVSSGKRPGTMEKVTFFKGPYLEDVGKMSVAARDALEKSVAR
ncbi:MAG TPA: hypothetical protein DCO77_02820 [Nitrospiraceae bacterium]|nr:hypothetical protein [Nitrospiraceae bacterium]